MCLVYPSVVVACGGVYMCTANVYVGGRRSVTSRGGGIASDEQCLIKCIAIYSLSERPLCTLCSVGTHAARAAATRSASPLWYTTVSLR